ncbi:hypothetical protein VTJ49DRAFT_829 [Mycothermus thermophilus]|uniref:Uncharacterized protein n=1 Tax=Humicola insolens TaxID=85995 RepID=A0ABR3VDV6_HUMIN
MFKTTIRTGAWRPRLRVPYHFPKFRGYATMQERVALSNERQWQIAAVAVTIPGLMYLRGGSSRRPEISQSNMTQRMQQVPGKVQAKVQESPMAQQAVRTITQTAPKQQFEAAVEKTEEMIDKTKEAAKEMLASAGGGGSASAASESSSGESSGVATPASESQGQSEAQAKAPEDTAARYLGIVTD